MAKIRTGFVSNSSSSSFLVLGFNIQNEKLYKKLEDKYNYVALDFYCGDEEGYVMGVDPINFLSREKLDDASKSAFLHIKDLMNEDDFNDLMEDAGVKKWNNNTPSLIYDSYYS